MFYHHRIATLFFAGTLFFLISACVPNEPESTVSPIATEVSQPIQTLPRAEVEISEQPAKLEVIEAAKPVARADQIWIATLKSSSNRVDFKSKSESIWQAVTPDMSFFRYDSIQTHERSVALVRYQSKSEIEVKEKSLLVFDEDPGTKNKKIDRVILKTGDLLGKTTTELWVLTDAGLVQISAGKMKSAKARVQIKDQQFKVSIDQGSALVTVKTQNNEIQKISVGQNNSIDLNTQDQIRPLAAASDSMLDFDQAIATAATIKQPTEQKITLENADETEITKKNVYLINGKISAVGAKLLINGEFVQVNPDLGFSKSINLTKGMNLIVLQVIRSDSTTQFIRKKVVLED